MTAVMEAPVCDRHRMVAQLRVSGLTCAEIAARLRYGSAHTVRKTLALPHVRAYRDYLRAQLERQFLDVQRFTLAEAVQSSARRDGAH